jgi:hypothetical protein
MERMEPKRPRFATIICLLTAVWVGYAIFRNLPGHQLAFTAENIQAQRIAPGLRYALHTVSWAVSIGGIVALWYMRPMASLFYAANIVLTLAWCLVNVFALHVLQYERMLSSVPTYPGARITMPPWAIYAVPILGQVLTVSIPVWLFFYVLHTTSRPRGRSAGHGLIPG